MADVHIIRQDYARALAAVEENLTEETAKALADAGARRDRAIRMIQREDHASVKHLSAMFRCSKTTIREALERDDS
jgi:hypothetical protein